MGTNVQTFRVDGSMSESEVQRVFQDRVDAARREYGNDPYSGSFATCEGLRVYEVEILESEAKAESFLDGRTCKREASAVRFHDTRKRAVKAPTYGGVDGFSAMAQFVSATVDRTKHGLPVVPADQLTDRQKELAVKRMRAHLDAVRIAEDAAVRFAAALRNAGDLTKPLDVPKLRKVRKDVLATLKKREQAHDALKEFDDRMREKLVKVVDGDRGTHWLVLGACAE